MTKKEIAQNEQFLLLPQCFPLLVIGYPFNYRDFHFFDKICSKSSATELSYEGKGLYIKMSYLELDGYYDVWNVGKNLLKEGVVNVADGTGHLVPKVKWAGVYDLSYAKHHHF